VRVLSKPWIEPLSYILVALGAVSPAIAIGGVVGDGVDLYGTFWFYWWIEQCIGGLTDPSYTDLMFHPMGKDIFAHTGNNFVDAIVAQPLMHLIGFPRYQAWFVALLLVGNALSFRLLAKDLFTHKAAVWASSLLWMLNPFVLFECMTGRLTQAFVWFLPLAIRHFLRAGRGGWRDPVLAGVYTALQAWTYWFMGWFMAIAMAWLGLIKLAEARHKWRVLLRSWLIAAAVCLVCILPAAVGMNTMASAGEVPGLVDGGGLFDVPAALGNNVSRKLHGYTLMETQGHPMFLYVVWGLGLLWTVCMRRNRWMWGGLALVSLAFAVGPVWPTSSGEDVVMPHYMLLYRHAPFFSRLWFPYRLLVITMLAVSVGLGFLVQRVGTRQDRWQRWVWALPLMLAAATMIEQGRHLAYPLLHRPLEVPDVYQEIGSRGGAVIDLPIGLARTTIVWQTVHGQPTFGGMGENARIFWPEGFTDHLNNPFVRFLRYVGRSPKRRVGYRPEDVATLTDLGFRWLVLDRKLIDAQEVSRSVRRQLPLREEHSLKVTAAMVDVIGTPVAAEGPLVVWDLLGGEPWAAPLTPTELMLTTRTWERAERTEHEALLRKLGRLKEKGE